MSAVTPAGGDTAAGRSWPDVLNGLLGGPGPERRRHRLGHGPHHAGRGHRRADRRLRGGAAGQGRDGRGDLRSRTRHVRARQPHRGARPDASTSSAPAATAPRPSTSPPCPRSSSPAPGAKVVKHGNRAASSASGASDVLEKLGVNLELPPQRVVEVAEEAGITFCFAVKFHPALRHVGARPAGSWGSATVFNFLGPLTNPAKVARPGRRRRRRPDGAHRRRSARRARDSVALVFRGDDGLDELTTTATSRVWVVRGRRRCARRPSTRGTSASTWCPSRRCGAPTPRTTRRWPGGCSTARPGRCGTRCCSTRRRRWSPSTPTDEPLAEQIRAGMAKAAQAIDSGAAKRALERWVAASNALSRHRRV